MDDVEKTVTWSTLDSLYSENAMMRERIAFALEHGLEENPDYAADDNLLHMQGIIEDVLEANKHRCKEIWDKARDEALQIAAEKEAANG